MKKLLIIICTFFYTSVSYSNEVKIAEDLYDELRCLVCQNQSIKESDAPIAQDLRFIVLEMLKEGKNKKEIKSFLVEKYGEFILFKPTFSIKNYILWLAPLIFLLIGFLIVYKSYRKQDKNNIKGLSVKEKKELSDLLNKDKKI